MDIHAGAHELQKLGLVVVDHFAQIDFSANVH
jgi:hypothetical protein